MKSLALILLRDRVVWMAGFLVAVVSIGLAVAPSDNLAAAATRASTTAMFVLSLAGALMSASVWGYAHEADVEEVGHNCGTPARWIRLRLFALMMLAVVLAAAWVLSIAMASAWAHGARGAVTWRDLREVAWTLTSLATTVAVATLISWRQPRTRSLATTTLVTLVPLLVFLGPRMTARPWVLAISPTTSPAVLLAPEQYPSAAVSIAALALAGAWVIALRVLMSTTVDPPGQPTGNRSALMLTRPRRMGGQSRLRVGVFALIGVLALGAFGPTLAEKIPYSQRYAASVQTAREQGPEDAVRAYLTSYSQGKLKTAARWTSSGDPHQPVEGMVVAFAQRVANALMEVESSPDIRSASVRIETPSKSFHACLVRPGRQWLIATISESPCG